MSAGERIVACCAAGGARGAEAAAAALAVAATDPEEESGGCLLLDVRAAARPRRGALLASAAARRLEGSLAEHPALRAAARGRLCFAAARSAPDDPPGLVRDLLDGGDHGASLVVCLCDASCFREVLAEAAGREPAALVRATPGRDRSLLALLSAELRAEAVPFKVWSAPIAAIPARRALAGLEPGGESGRRAERLAATLARPARRVHSRPMLASLAAERAQALPAMLGIAVLVVALALILAAFGGAATAKGRLQRAADLAALSAARSLRDDFPRLFVPALRADGAPNPEHLERSQYLARARAAGAEAAERNGIDERLVRVQFPDGSSMAPLRVAVEVRASIALERSPEAPEAATDARAEAEVTPPSVGSSLLPATASGGGYAGPLAYRQGEGMRPDVAEAFDRMAAAAAADGVTLVINSGFRSDAEQRQLWEQNPDPRMVAPPGTSLHRCGTELDLGPAAAYGWLASNAPRFSFTKRYSWEPWHFGFDGGPAPCSAAGDRVGAGGGDGAAAGGGGLPSFVPDRYRRPLLASAARHGVSAALLAAQIMAESNFNPNAVSPAGALGIAQFMPATAAAYGLDDPFDPEAAIDAQARMMAELVSRFRSLELALAAYNAGPGAVAACDCVPPYPETQAYVARIMGLLDGAGAMGALPPPTLEVRLVG